MGFFAICLMVDPRNFGCPQSRPRFYLPFVSRAWLKEHTITEVEWHRWVTDHVKQFSLNNGMLRLNSFIMPETSKCIQLALADARQANSNMEPGEVEEQEEDGDQSGMKWPQKHLDRALATGHRWWETSGITSELKAKYPVIGLQTSRPIDILRLNDVSFPEPEKQMRLVETSVSSNRSRSVDHCIECVTPKMKRWITSRCRMVHGQEAMLMQGIAFDEDILSNFTDEYLSELAGNAFHTGCFQACYLATLSACALGFYRKKQYSGAAEASKTAGASSADSALPPAQVAVAQTIPDTDISMDELF